MVDRQRFIIAFILIILIVGASLGAVFLLQRSIVVEAAIPVKEDPDSRVKAPGIVRLAETGTLFAPLAGLIEKVQVQPGDSIQAGQTVVTYSVDSWKDEIAIKRLDLRDLQDSLIRLEEGNMDEDTRLRRTIEAAQADLDALRQEQQELDLALANQRDANESSIQTLQAQVAAQQKEVARLEPLYASGAISRKEYEQAQETLAALKDQLKRAQDDDRVFYEKTMPLKREGMSQRLAQAGKALENARLDLNRAGDGSSQMAVLRDRISLVRSEIALLESYLKKAAITLPYSGRVTEVNVAPGQPVQKGAELIKVADTARFEVVALVPLSSLHRVQPGQNVEIRLEEVEPALAATVESVSTREKGGAVEVSIAVNDRPELLKAGATVQVEIITPGHQFLVLPPQAVVEKDVPKTSPILLEGEDRIYYVFVVDEETRKVTPKRVKVGVIKPTYVEIVSGITDKDYVVVGNAEALTRLRAKLAEWEKKQLREFRAVFQEEQ